MGIGMAASVSRERQRSNRKVSTYFKVPTVHAIIPPQEDVENLKLLLELTNKAETQVAV